MTSTSRTNRAGHQSTNRSSEKYTEVRPGPSHRAKMRQTRQGAESDRALRFESSSHEHNIIEEEEEEEEEEEKL